MVINDSGPGYNPYLKEFEDMLAQHEQKNM